jgi:hypothetical protein
MLKHLTVQEAQFIATLAKAARIQRDKVLGHIREEAVEDVQPARGEHNPTATLGFEPLTLDSPQLSALREAMATLQASARYELYALMRIGQGHLAPRDLPRGTSEAHGLGDDAVSAAMMDDADLHDHLVKGLYEADLAE